MTRRATIVKGLGSALLLALVVVGVPSVLIRVGAFPSSIPDLPSLWRAATGPDTSNRAVFAVLAALVWLSWASFTTSVLREIGAAIRSRGARPARPLPGLSWSAHPAALLVAAVVAMFVAAPLLTATAPQAGAAGTCAHQYRAGAPAGGRRRAPPRRGRAHRAVRLAGGDPTTTGRTGGSPPGRCRTHPRLGTPATPSSVTTPCGPSPNASWVTRCATARSPRSTRTCSPTT